MASKDNTYFAVKRNVPENRLTQNALHICIASVDIRLKQFQNR